MKWKRIYAVLTAVLLIWNRPLLLAFGASGNTIGYAVQYMQIYALGTLFVELTLGLNAFITAQGFAPANRIPAIREEGFTIVSHAEGRAVADVVEILDRKYSY